VATFDNAIVGKTFGKFSCKQKVGHAILWSIIHWLGKFIHLQFENNCLGAWPNDQEDSYESGSISFRGKGNMDHVRHGSPISSLGPRFKKEVD